MPDPEEQTETPTGSGDVVPVGVVDDDGDLTLSLDDERQGAEEPEDGEDGDGLSRRERRRLRYDEAVRAAEQEREARLQRERELEAEREHRRRMEYRLQEIDQRTQSREPDPYEEEIRRLKTEEQSLYSEHSRYGSQWDEATRKQKMERAYELQENRWRLEMRREMARNQPQAQAQDPVIALFKASYPDVYTNERAYMWAESRARQHVAEGRQVTPNLLKEVLDETRKRFRTGGEEVRREPTEQVRQRFGGMPKGGSGGDTGQRGNFKISKEERALAREMYPGRKAEVAYKLFYKNVLSKGS